MALTMRVAVAVMGFWRAAQSLMGLALSPCINTAGVSLQSRPLLTQALQLGFAT